ncbi:olfactory receptor 10K2-like [Lepus europaeus]|uniref:olfactory receptor 10K2-like n=1 Tax=Lepus europaeus TaxID=9983 RepID=UPI002B4930F0|nr:olfactory receptor 10K2-like [Lepus europaeus]
MQLGLSAYSTEKLGDAAKMKMSSDDVHSVEWVNETVVREFVFLGFSSLAGLQQLLFLVFLVVYLFTLGTNAIIISTIVLDRALHTPMYFFLAVLSCSETCYTFVIVPKMLVDLLAQKKTISFLGCAIQMFTFLFLGCSHSFLLAAMGYDRYVAICNPLRYTVLMGPGVCVGLVAAACACGFTVAQIITTLIFHLPFYSSNQLHHFFCDISPVLKLASHHNHFSQIVIFMLCALVLIIPLLLILVSYIHIISAILQFPSTLGTQEVPISRLLYLQFVVCIKNHKNVRRLKTITSKIFPEILTSKDQEPYHKVIQDFSEEV